MHQVDMSDKLFYQIVMFIGKSLICHPTLEQEVHRFLNVKKWVMSFDTEFTNLKCDKHKLKND
jgi:hypothetical protein